MATTIEATFDGQVFRPSGPISLPPNTVVRITIESLPDVPPSFLKTARSLSLEGPTDWARKLDSYLYGEEPEGAE
jgi:hypothetical protein